MLAECGGIMSLFKSLSDIAGTEYALAGLLPGKVHMQKKLAAFGMQEVDLPQGYLRGHSFDYSNTDGYAVCHTSPGRPRRRSSLSQLFH